MARHFLGLYLLIVLTLAVVSWGQDRLLQAYSSPDAADEKAMAVALFAFANYLHEVPPDRWKQSVAAAATSTGTGMELFATGEIAGRETLQKLGRGEIAYLQASTGDSWALKRLTGDYVLAIRSAEPPTQRRPLEWILTLLFYAVIALVIMIWIWPLTRDLRVLENAAARFGDRNWSFEVAIGPHSQIRPLAETFRRMAARIDGLIASHKEMSNAVSHEIRTPLARMQFEIELAQQAMSVAEVADSLAHIKADIAQMNDLVKATLEYAILERADVSLNISTHNFTTLIPAITDYVRRDARPDVLIGSNVQSDATEVLCDVHLLETVLRNLLYNAARYAKREISVTFTSIEGVNQLLVEDDGPGIAEQDRRRVFDSFVQLDRAAGQKTGFGLGLAIVKRAIEWHGGKVDVARSPLGGARFCATWPALARQSIPAD